MLTIPTARFYLCPCAPPQGDLRKGVAARSRRNPAGCGKSERRKGACRLACRSNVVPATEAARRLLPCREAHQQNQLPASRTIRRSRDYGRTGVKLRLFYRRIPLLAFFSRKATSKAGICPLLRWMTETKSECCALAMLMPLTITSVTL